MTLTWQDVVDDLEGLVGAWHAIAAGDDDVEIVELPTLPDSPIDHEIAGRLIALHAEMMVVERQLASAQDLTAEQLSELKNVHSAANQYLRA